MSITVCALFRPSSNEKQVGTDVCFQKIDDENVILKDERDGEFTFTFDRVYYEESNETDIFQFLAAPILQDAINGLNGTIFTLGQGPCLAILLESLASTKLAIKFSMVEIYMEKIRDIFDLSKDDLKIKDNNEGLFLDGVTEIHLLDAAAALKSISDGMAKREAGETQVNLASSRSHFVYIFRVQEKMHSKRIKTGKLLLVDLAGYVKEEKTGAEGRVLEEAKMIDKSLSTLGSVLNALISSPKGKVNHVLYQDSKLTHLLQDALGGNSRTALLCCCSPSAANASETISILRFGARHCSAKKHQPQVLEFRHLLPSTKSGIEALGSNLHLTDVRTLCEQRALEAFKINETNWRVFPSSRKLIETIEAVCFQIILHGPVLEDDEKKKKKEENEKKDEKKKKKIHLPRNFKILFLHPFHEEWPTNLTEKQDFHIINESGVPDYKCLEKELNEFKPALVACCSANLPLYFNYRQIEERCIKSCSNLVLDISHISPLILAGLWNGPSPFDHAQVVISKFSDDDDSLLIFVHKTRVVDGAKDEIMKYSIDSDQRSYVYMAALLKNATSASFRLFQQTAIQNATIFSQTMVSKGYKVAVCSTQNRTTFVFIFLENKGCTASQVSKVLEMIGIYAVEHSLSGGLSFCTSILTSRGFTGSDIEVAACIVDCVVQLVARIVSSSSETAAEISKERFESLLEAYEEELNQHRRRCESLSEAHPEDIIRFMGVEG